MLTLDVVDIGMAREERMKERYHPQKRLGVRSGLPPGGRPWPLVLDAVDWLAPARGPGASSRPTAPTG